MSAELFFGEPEGSRERKGRWKTLQLCKQVEHAAALVIEECEDPALAAAVVVGVEPAPDASRLRVLVALPPAGGEAAAAREALQRLAGRFREETARSIHRKRVPEVIAEVVAFEESKEVGDE
ncbi:MAG TPA: ribosome-binding factor A [Vicinamibacteria bacterium]